MKFIVITVFLAFAASISSADDAPSSFVLHGEDASIRDFPYMAKVWNLNWPACGGAILSQRSVLTV
jgi:secreted trypsin-like serine protease